MNKKIIIGIIVFLVIAFLIVFGAFMFFNNNNQSSNNNTRDNSLNETKTEEIKENISNKTDKKVLVAYFSYSGNTKSMAEEIASETSGDLFEIQTDKEYSDLTNETKEEITRGERHTLTKKVDNIDQYDVIFVGYPVWWHSTPVQINTFLEANNLSGKVVVPFCTSGSSDISETISSFKNSCKDCVVLEGITITDNNATTEAGKTKIANWLNNLGIFE